MTGDVPVLVFKPGSYFRFPLLFAIIFAVFALIVLSYVVLRLVNNQRALRSDILLQEKTGVEEKIHLEGSGPTLTIEEMSSFEKEIGGRLSDDYKRFLLFQNGGLCEPLLGFPFAGVIHEVGCFHSLLPAGSDSGIRNNLHRLLELNPVKFDGYLPIARTFSEGEICLAYRGNDVGAVFFTAFKDNAMYTNDAIPIDVTMVRVADSFGELLHHLVKIPNPYCRIEDLGKHGSVEDLATYLAEGHSIDAVGKNHVTIVSEAIRANNLAMIKSCIERGATLSGTIRAAVQARRTNLIKMLVKAGAEINERDDFGFAPLRYASGWGLPGAEGKRNRELRDLLIELGAKE